MWIGYYLYLHNHLNIKSFYLLSILIIMYLGDPSRSNLNFNDSEMVTTMETQVHNCSKFFMLCFESEL